MKTIIFLLTLVIAVVMISGYKQTAQNEKAVKHLKPASQNDFKGINKSDAGEYKSDQVSGTQKTAPEERPKILLMLTNDTGLADWSPYLWWNYQHSKPGRNGC
jgi:hypothetical protein